MSKSKKDLSVKRN